MPGIAVSPDPAGAMKKRGIRRIRQIIRNRPAPAHAGVISEWGTTELWTAFSTQENSTQNASVPMEIANASDREKFTGIRDLADIIQKDPPALPPIRKNRRKRRIRNRFERIPPPGFQTFHELSAARLPSEKS